MEAIRKKLTQIKSERDEAREDVERLRGEMKEKTSQHDGIETDKMNLERKVKLLEDDLDKAEDHLAKVRSDNADLEAKVDDLERVVKSLESTQNNDEDIKDQLDSTKKTSESKIVALENECDDLRRKVKILEGDLSASEDLNDSYKTKITDLEKELHEKQHLVINKERSDEQYAQTEEDLREQLLALKAEVRKQEDEKDAAIREVAKLTRDIDIVEGDLEKSEKKCADLKHEHDEMMAELGDL